MNREYCKVSTNNVLYLWVTVSLSHNSRLLLTVAAGQPILCLGQGRQVGMGQLANINNW